MQNTPAAPTSRGVGVFDDNRELQYASVASFQAVAATVADVVLNFSDNFNQAYKEHKAELCVTRQSFYAKTRGVEPAVLYVTYMGRESPNLPCDAVFAEPEWKSVWKIVSDEPLSKTAPPLSTFIPMLAQLGGHNGRKHDAPAGPQAIWTGIRRMTDFAFAWIRFDMKARHET